LVSFCKELTKSELERSLIHMYVGQIWVELDEQISQCFSFFPLSYFNMCLFGGFGLDVVNFAPHIKILVWVVIQNHNILLVVRLYL